MLTVEVGDTIIWNDLLPMPLKQLPSLQTLSLWDLLVQAHHIPILWKLPAPIIIKIRRGQRSE